MTPEFTRAALLAQKHLAEMCANLHALAGSILDAEAHKIGRETLRKAIEDLVPTAMQVAQLDSRCRELLEAWPGQRAPLLGECTGVSASWCPVHGDCACKNANDKNDDDCPLHSRQSTHGETVATNEQVEEAFSRR